MAALFAGIGYFKKGRMDGKLDAITLMEKDIMALKKRIGDLEAIGQENQVTIEALYKENVEKNKKLAEVLQILQGRDPKMQEIMKKIEEYIQAGKPTMEAINEKVLPVIDELDKFLKAQKVVGTVLSQK